MRADAQSGYRFGAFELWPGAHTVTRQGEALELAPKEFATLLLLLERAGQVVDKEIFIQDVWEGAFVGDGSLARTISVLRKHIGADAIETVTRLGYRFAWPVTRISSAPAIRADLTSTSPSRQEIDRRRLPPPLRIALSIFAAVLIAMLAWPGIHRWVGRQARATSAPPADEAISDPHAYQEYLDGRRALDEKSVPGFWRALEHFREATQSDPRYARAYAAISETYINLADNIPARPAYANAKLAAQEALQLDDHLADAHRDLAWTLFNNEADVQGAEREYRRALALNPKDSRTRHWYSQLLVAEHRPEEAIKQAKAGLDLDPLSLSSNYNYGFILICAGQPQAALDHLKELLQREPDNEVANGYTGLAYEGLGEYETASRFFHKAMEISALKYQYEAAMGHAMAKGGDRVGAQKIADSLERKTKDGIWIPGYNMAVLYAGLGERDKAFYWLDRCVDDRSCSLLEINTGPIYQELRQDTRFKAIADRLGAAKIPAQTKQRDSSEQHVRSPS